MDLLLKYRFFVLMAIYVALRYFSAIDLATIVFFVAILDSSNVMNKKEK